MSSKKFQVAKILLGMTYKELSEVSLYLARMQDAESGVKWKPHKAYGEHGMMEMLHSWAEYVIEEE